MLFGDRLEGLVADRAAGRRIADRTGTEYRVQNAPPGGNVTAAVGEESILAELVPIRMRPCGDGQPPVEAGRLGQGVMKQLKREGLYGREPIESEDDQLPNDVAV